MLSATSPIIFIRHPGYYCLFQEDVSTKRLSITIIETLNFNKSFAESTVAIKLMVFNVSFEAI